MSAITIAKYETNKLPSARTLQRLADLARDHELEQEARVLTDAASAYASTPEAHRRFVLTAAFHNFIDGAGLNRVREMENLLAPEISALEADLGALSTAAAHPRPTEVKSDRSAADLFAAAALLIERTAERTRLRDYLLHSISRLIGEKEHPLSTEELSKLGELGSEAAAMRAAIDERNLAAAGISLPQAIRGLRERGD